MLTRILSTTALCAAASLPLLAAELVTDGDFEGITAMTSASNPGIATAGQWLGNVNAQRAAQYQHIATDGSTTFAFIEEGDISRYMQLCEASALGTATSGSISFSFDYQVMADQVTTDSHVPIQIVGLRGTDTEVDTALDDSAMSRSRRDKYDFDSGHVELLVDDWLPDQAADGTWYTYSKQIDYTQGPYDYILISIGIGSSKWAGLSLDGDTATTLEFLRLDNVSLDGGTSTAPIPSLSALAVSHEEVQLTWDAVSPAPTGTEPGYEVWRKAEGEVDFSHVANIAEDGSASYSYNDGSLSPSTTYEYRVDAVDDMATLP